MNNLIRILRSSAIAIAIANLWCSDGPRATGHAAAAASLDSWQSALGQTQAPQTEAPPQPHPQQEPSNPDPNGQRQLDRMPVVKSRADSSSRKK